MLRLLILVVTVISVASDDATTGAGTTAAPAGNVAAPAAGTPSGTVSGAGVAAGTTAGTGSTSGTTTGGTTGADTLPFINPCSVNVETDKSFDFTKFVTDGGGKWEYAMKPSLAHVNSDLDRLSGIAFEESKEKPGTYTIKYYYKTKDGKEEVLSQGSVEDSKNGRITIRADFAGIKNVEFKFAILKYVQNRYASYYACSDKGGDKTTDNRFVLSHGSLTRQEEDEIKKLETKYNFKGPLKDAKTGATVNTQSGGLFSLLLSPFTAFINFIKGIFSTKLSIDNNGVKLGTGVKY